MGDLHLHLRRQRLTLDDGGHRVWRAVTEEAAWPAAATALLLCDVWDWSSPRLVDIPILG